MFVKSIIGLRIISISKLSEVTFRLECLYRCRGESKFTLFVIVGCVTLGLSVSSLVPSSTVISSPSCGCYMMSCGSSSMSSPGCPCSMFCLCPLSLIVLILSSKEEKVVANTFPILKQDKDSLVASAVLLNGSGPRPIL